MSNFIFWAVVAMCAEIVALTILILIISVFNRSRKKKVVIVKKQTCPRCSRDNVKLYPWKDF